MDFVIFKVKIQESVPVGTVFDNPGGGTSEVISLSDSKISYRRGNATIYVSLQDLFNAYAAFCGRRVSSPELKQSAPSVFDSQARPAGHDCNATFLFLVLRQIGIVCDIKGSGVRGDPYYVDIPQ